MIFGKHINRYYLKYAPQLLLGLLTLVAVDYLQLVVPNMYQMVVNGMSPSNRGTKWANSGMVVEVLPEDEKSAEW